MVTHRYDLPNLFVCVASIKYWYPNIEIVIIKNTNNGDVDLSFLKNYYNISFASDSDYNFGIFYGSLLPFLAAKEERFIIVDTDTAFTGPIIDYIESFNEQFVLDFEEQPLHKLKVLYWDPEQVANYVKGYSDNWFTFNNGIIAATSNLIRKDDFSDFLIWEDDKEPEMKNDRAFPMFDQSAINVVINKKYDTNSITVTRQPIMIYPPFYTGNEMELLAQIQKRNGKEYRVIHWADQKNISLTQRPLGKIYRFYLEQFFKGFSKSEQIRIHTYLKYLSVEASSKKSSRRVIRKLKGIIFKQSS
jgi:hypothetical protein